MDREGGNKSHAKQIPGLNMQQYVPMKLINPTIPITVPDHVPALITTSDPNPNPTHTPITVPDSNPNPKNEHHHHQPAPPEPRAAAREQDQYLPIANVIRIMRRILPPHAKISDEAKETVQECVSEYISFITGEANDRCRREQRKTVTAEDVLWAMTKLGFDSYISPLSLYIARYRELESSGTLMEVTGKRRAAEYPPPLVPVVPASGGYYSPVFYNNPMVMSVAAPLGGATDYLVMQPGEGGPASAGREIGGPVMGSNFDPFVQFK